MAVVARRLVRPAAGFELASWYFFRLSGALLIAFALVHIVITHYLNAPSNTIFSFVAARWIGPFWRTFDWILLVLALLHGLNGARIVIDDYVHPRGWRIFAQSANWTLAILFAAGGSINIFTFDPARTANVTNLATCHAIDTLLVVISALAYFALIAGLLWAGIGLWRGTLHIYYGGAGQWAWILHRAAGLGIVFFLLIHIVDITLLGFGAALYDCTVRFYATPLLLPMEIGLVAAVLYHALNGIRVMLIDFSTLGVRREQALFYAALALSVLFLLPSIYVIATQ